MVNRELMDLIHLYFEGHLYSGVPPKAHSKAAHQTH